VTGRRLNHGLQAVHSKILALALMEHLRQVTVAAMVAKCVTVAIPITSSLVMDASLTLAHAPTEHLRQVIDVFGVAKCVTVAIPITSSLVMDASLTLAHARTEHLRQVIDVVGVAKSVTIASLDTISITASVSKTRLNHGLQAVLSQSKCSCEATRGVASSIRSVVMDDWEFV